MKIPIPPEFLFSNLFNRDESQSSSSPVRTDQKRNFIVGGGDHEQFRQETSDLTVDRVRLISERVRFEGGHPSVTQATTEIDKKRGLGCCRR